jgi:quercetin dioxygenase-like cupin family protein
LLVMAYKGKEIVNPVTKQRIRFLQTAKDTNGQLLEMESTFAANSVEPAAHYHPVQEEDFTVLEGELTVKMAGQTLKLKAGDSLHISPGLTHAMWNNTGKTTVVNWQVRPAMNSEHLLETAAGLANDGKVNRQGMPSILQVALMANKYSKVFRLSKPSFALQKIVFTVLTPVALLAGLKPDYEEYLD